MNITKKKKKKPESKDQHLGHFKILAYSLDKEDVVHIYDGILLSHKKEWSNAIYSKMDRPRDDHIKWSKPVRERQISYDITFMGNLKKMIQIKLYTNQK